MATEVDLSCLSEKLKLNEGYDVKNSNFIAALVEKKFLFVSVIEALAEVLTNQDVAIRERGVDFLSWVVTEVPQELFGGQEISVIVNFYCDRLKDHHNIAPATIKGLLALSSDKIPVTREDLAEGLTKCLSARPDFADHCLPLILEKLSSTLKSARIDSYRLLCACCSTYPVASVSKHSSELWKILQKDTLPVVDAQIGQAALDALSEVVRLFASSDSERHILKQFLDDVLIAVRTFLGKPEDSLFHPAINVLLAISSKSTVAAKYVLGHLRLIFAEDAVKTANQRLISLASMKPFLPAMKACGHARSSEPEDANLFAEVVRFHLESAASVSADVRRLAFVGIRDLVADLNEAQSARLMEIVAKSLKTEQDENVRAESLQILRQLATITPREVIRLLESNLETSSGDSPTDDAEAFARAVSAVADLEETRQFAVPLLINMATKGSRCDLGLGGLLSACRTAGENNSTGFMESVHRDHNLVQQLLVGWTHPSAENLREGDGAVLENLAEIVALVVRHQIPSVQQELVDSFAPGLLDGIDANAAAERNVIILEAIVGSVRSSVTLDKLPQLQPTLIRLALRSEAERVRTSAARLLASILMKQEDASQLLDLACEEAFAGLKESNPMETHSNSTNLLNWMVKGLLLANSPFLEPLVSRWFDLMERPDVGSLVADEGFRIVLRDEALYLNLSSHCNVKILFRQRFFTYFPRLMKRFGSSEGATRMNYLLALTRLVDGVPRHAVAAELANVLLLMAQALESDKPEVVTVALGILRDFLDAGEPLLQSHVHGLVPKLLRLSRFPGFMQIRIGALRCLYCCAFYPTATLLPLKDDVIRDLEPCLDDKKRLVRNEAVRARSRWFLVGAPGEEAIFS